VENSQINHISSTQKLAGSLIVGKLLALIAAFAIPMLLTRFLTKADYGLYAQLYTVIMLITVFFEFGISSNLYYYYPTAEPHEKSIFVFQTLLLLCIFSGFAALIISIPEFRNLIIGKGDLNNYASYIIILVVVMIPTAIITPLYVVKNDHQTAVLYPIIEVILRAGFISIFVIIIPGVHAVFNAMIASAIVVLSFIVYYLYKEIGSKNILIPIDFNRIKNQINYSLPFGMANSIYTFSRMFDKLMCISYLSTSSYATYAIAFYGVPGIQQIYDSLAQVTIVRMTKYIQNGNKKEALRIYKKMIVQTYSFSIPVILIVCLYAKKIIVFLFTEKFADSTHLFQAYLGTFLIVILGVDLILRASGETKYALKAHLFSAIISIPTTFILIRQFGLWGAMTGAMISMTIPMLFMFAKEIKIMETRLINFLPWRQMISIVLISIVIFIPFLIVEFFFSFGIILSGILAFFYLLIVSAIEVKYNLFILESEQIRNILLKYGNKLSAPTVKL